MLLVLAPATPSANAEDEDSPADPASEEREVLLPPEPIDTAVPGPSEDMDEMIVRATGRDDLLKDLSISSTSFSAAEIKSLRLQNIADLAEYTPNLEINTRSAASNPTIFIRGIGLKDYNANAAGAVAVYQDGVNINSAAVQLGQLFDTEEIVVLRGPQGSVNGRNATAGAIMINSILPSGEFETSGDFSYGNYKSINVNGAVALPLVERVLSTRMSFTANFRKGTTKNNCADWDPESIGKPLQNEETIRAAWVAHGSPTTKQGNLPTPNDNLTGCNNNLGCQFPKANADPGSRQTEGLDENGNKVGRVMNVDRVCVWEDPGQLRFGVEGREGEAVWVPNPNAGTTADFQGLDHNVNNVKNWATRGIIRYQPDVGDGMDWILTFHGGQNLGDSSRLQSMRTRFITNAGDPFIVEDIAEVSEARAATNSGLEFEGIRAVEGIYTKDSNASNLVPGGRGGRDIDAGFYDLDGKEKLDTWGTSLRGLWDIGPVSVTSISGYLWYDRDIDDEGDAVPIADFPAIYNDDAWQFSHEMRVSGDGERHRWAAGGFFLYEDLESGNTFPGLRLRRIEQTWEQTLASGAGYLNGRYWLMDEVYVDGGLRYNVEHKKFTLNSQVTIAGDDVADCNTGPEESRPPGCLIPEETKKKTWTGLTGDATIAWEPGGDWMYDARLDHLNLYFKYGRGMKGGHFNAGLTIQSNTIQKQRIDPVKPEFLHSVEGGFSSRWFQNRLTASFAMFRYWYQDLQVFDFTNEVGELPTQQLLNSDAKVLGAEIEIQARPLPGLLLQFGGGWIESEFKDFQVVKAVTVPRTQGNNVGFDYSGNPLISAPKWNFSGLVEWQIPLSRWGSLVPRYTYSYRSKVYLDPQKLDPISQEPYWIHNARLAYRTPDGRYEIAGWVENFMDERYRIDSFDLSLGENAILEVWNDPRMYGFTISAYF